VAPAQIGELGEVAIEADPFASVFERERGVLGIGDQRATRLCAPAEPLEDLPVAIARPRDARVATPK
jgi:hypothetical protein